MPLRPVRSRVVLSESLVRRHQSGVWRYLRFLGAQPDVADDLTQEAFLKLQGSPPEDRGDAATGAWLRTVARRALLRRGSLRTELQLASEADLEAAWVEGEGSADPASGHGYSDALAHCLETLTRRARTAVHLRYHENHSRGEIAVAVGVSEEGVKSILRRAREALHTCIQRHTERRTQR